jgi:hypothetical protein
MHDTRHEAIEEFPTGKQEVVAAGLESVPLGRTTGLCSEKPRDGARDDLIVGSVLRHRASPAWRTLEG